jgi:hypothetical protein
MGLFLSFFAAPSANALPKPDAMQSRRKGRPYACQCHDRRSAGHFLTLSKPVRTAARVNFPTRSPETHWKKDSYPHTCGAVDIGLYGSDAAVEQANLHAESLCAH